MRIAFALALSVTLFASSARADDPPRLPARAWDPTNRAVLERWLAGIAAKKAPGLAVFDFDNTLIFHDCGEATFRFQLEHLRWKLTPAQLGELIPEEIDGVRALRGGETLADVRADLLGAYEQLWPRIQAGEGEAVRESEAARDLRAKLLWFYDEAYETPGIGALYAYPLLARFLGGFTPEEVDALTRAALEVAQAEEPAAATWESATPGRIGARRGSFYRGLRAQPEMIDLVRALQQAGVECFVVSASAEPIVEASAAALGYPFDAAHVFGIRVDQDAEGRLTTRPTAGYPVTWRQGKVDLIRAQLPAEPLLVAGDTFTDVEMLTAFPSTEVRLLINRNKAKDELAPLYRDGASAGERAPAPGAPRVVLQGRDEPHGVFRAGLETIPLGETAPRPLTPG